MPGLEKPDDVQRPTSEQIFDIPAAQVKPMVEPRPVGNDIVWEAISGEQMGRRFHTVTSIPITESRQLDNTNMPQIKLFGFRRLSQPPDRISADYNNSARLNYCTIHV